MKTNLDILVRRAKGAEVDMLLDWSARSGSDCCVSDASYWQAVDASGLLLGLVDGKPAGAVVALRYNRGIRLHWTSYGAACLP